MGPGAILLPRYTNCTCYKAAIGRGGRVLLMGALDPSPPVPLDCRLVPEVWSLFGVERALLHDRL